MKTRLMAVALAALAGLASVSAQAQFAKPEDAIKYRKSTIHDRPALGPPGCHGHGSHPF